MKKQICFFLSVVMAAGVMFSAIYTIFVSNEKMWSRSKEEVREEWFRSYDEYYRCMALYNSWEKNTNLLREPGRETGFRFGIVQGEDLDRIDLSKEESYLNYNFSTFPEKDALKNKEVSVYSFTVEPGENLEYSFNGSVWNAYGKIYLREDTWERSEIQFPITGYYYDTEAGIFFYGTREKFYRVSSVGIMSGDRGIHFTYNPQTKKYREEGNPEVSLTLNEMGKYYGEEYGYGRWQSVSLDENYIDVAQLHFVPSGEIGEISENYYIRAANGILYRYAQDGELPKEEPKTYHILYYRENTGAVPSDFSQAGDLYEQGAWILDRTYYFRNYAVPMLVIFGILWLAITGVFLTMTKVEKRRVIPMEIACIIPGIMALATLLIGVDFIGGYYGGYGFLGIGCFPVVYGIVLFWLYDMIVRIRQGRLKEQFLCWNLLKKIGRSAQRAYYAIRENTSLFVKSILLFIASWLLIVLGCAIFLPLGVFLILVIFVALLMMTYQLMKLQQAAERLAAGDFTSHTDTSHMFWEMKKHGDCLNRIGEGLNQAVEKRMKSERFRTELITNVSHDIKTPLTSIITYVDLLEKEETDNPKIKEYTEVLSGQSVRLKKLIEDLMEASKASTGNLEVRLSEVDPGVFIGQLLGEYDDKLKEKKLEVLVNKPETEGKILTDAGHLYRVLDNLFQNVYKYALEGTRVYIDLAYDPTRITIKNISAYPLNMTEEELLERFARGDKSRHTQGNGLGLAIAKSLMELMGGNLKLIVDGDLFKVELFFQ